MFLTLALFLVPDFFSSRAYPFFSSGVLSLLSPYVATSPYLFYFCSESAETSLPPSVVLGPTACLSDALSFFTPTLDHKSYIFSSRDHQLRLGIRLLSLPAPCNENKLLCTLSPYLLTVFRLLIFNFVSFAGRLYPPCCPSDFRSRMLSSLKKPI